MYIFDRPFWEIPLLCCNYSCLLLCCQKAEAELAYELQAAKTKQRLREEEMQIQVVERTQQILVQEQEIMRKEKELDSKVRRPAEAEKYKYSTKRKKQYLCKFKTIKTN